MTDNVTAINNASRAPYQKGRMKIERTSDSTFTLSGDVLVGGAASDHFQILYEALEIAANSNDPYKAHFIAMRDELMEQSEDWAD